MLSKIILIRSRKTHMDTDNFRIQFWKTESEWKFEFDRVKKIIAREEKSTFKIVTKTYAFAEEKKLEVLEDFKFESEFISDLFGEVPSGCSCEDVSGYDVQCPDEECRLTWHKDCLKKDFRLETLLPAGCPWLLAVLLKIMNHT